MDEKRNDFGMQSSIPENAGAAPPTEDQEDERIRRTLAEFKVRMLDALDRLDEDQRAMMVYRYRIENGKFNEIRTLQETADKFGVTRDRVRYTDQKLLRLAGIRRACTISRRKKLSDYL